MPLLMSAEQAYEYMQEMTGVIGAAMFVRVHVFWRLRDAYRRASSAPSDARR